MSLNNLTITQSNQTSWLKIGYGLVGVILLSQICSTVYSASLSLRDNQKLVGLQQHKQELAIQQAELDRTIAKQTAIKPIQQAMASEFVPITKFMTASRHLTVASR